jgi:hypothetical protein
VILNCTPFLGSDQVWKGIFLVVGGVTSVSNGFLSNPPVSLRAMDYNPPTGAHFYLKEQFNPVLKQL